MMVRFGQSDGSYMTMANFLVKSPWTLNIADQKGGSNNSSELPLNIAICLMIEIATQAICKQYRII